jgi:hypothetical protein
VVHGAPAVAEAEQEADAPEYPGVGLEADEPLLDDEAQATLETQMDQQLDLARVATTSDPEKNGHTPAAPRIQAVMVTSTLPLMGHPLPQVRCP